MKRDLPKVIRDAQLLARTNPELKALLYNTLKSLSALKAGEELKWLREEIDLAIDESSDETKCAKGCHHCCFHPITLSQEEFRSIQEAPISKERLNAQIGHFSADQPISYEDRACIYLKDGQCSVYEERPLICRLTHVSSVPQNCHLEGGEAITHLPVTKAALMAGAYYMLHNDLDLIPLFSNKSQNN